VEKMVDKKRFEDLHHSFGQEERPYKYGVQQPQTAAGNGASARRHRNRGSLAASFLECASALSPKVGADLRKSGEWPDGLYRSTPNSQPLF